MEKDVLLLKCADGQQRKWLAEQLENAGIDVVSVESVARAREAIKRFKFSRVVVVEPCSEKILRSFVAEVETLGIIATFAASVHEVIERLQPFH